MTPEQKENGQLGIELMTAWVGSENNNDFLAARSGLFLDDQNTIPDKMAAGKAPAGVAAVASELLLVLTQLTGRMKEAVLQEIAKKLQPED